MWPEQICSFAKYPLFNANGVKMKIVTVIFNIYALKYDTNVPRNNGAQSGLKGQTKKN